MRGRDPHYGLQDVKKDRSQLIKIRLFSAVAVFFGEDIIIDKAFDSV